MKFVSVIIVVEDVLRSRHLYETILGQEVVADFGIYNVGFEGGLALYKKSLFQDLVGGLQIGSRSNNFVLYFETEDLEAAEKAVRAQGFEFVHPMREQPWKQRVFRFYDYDQHMIEAAEVMQAVTQRLFQKGESIEAIAQVTGMPVEEVRKQVERRK